MGNLKVGGVSVIGGVACKCPQGVCSPAAEVNSGVGTIVCRISRPIATLPTNAEDWLAAQPDPSNFSAVADPHRNNAPNIAQILGKE